MDEPLKYHVLVSPKARDMLLEHLGFLAQVSPSAAEALLDEFEKRQATLETFPERCPYYHSPYIQPGKYRRLAFSNYLLILFQIDGNKVLIDLIIDTRAENADVE
jgi:hypothetical protein